MNTRAQGNEAERLAADFLSQKGWTIHGHNLHFHFGEVDILAEESDYLVVVEVKAKKSASFGYAVEMLTPAKKSVLRRLAKWVGSRYNKPVRVDVVTVDNFPSAHPIITHYPFAVEE